MSLSRDDIHRLAKKRYRNQFEDMDLAAAIFGLLVDVADAYVKELEDKAGDDPAPYLGLTPMDAALAGLRENLDMVRGGDR